MAALIIASETGFWLLLAAGLWSRYHLGRKRLGAVLLALTPAVDLVLLMLTTIDLADGATAGQWHAVAAVYVGVSIAFGPQLIGWADARFARRFADAPAPAPPVKHGPAHARRERAGWYRHVLAWAIGSSLLLAGIGLVADSARTAALQNMILLWTLVLAIDFLWSFSYTLWPRRVGHSSAQ